ncbi:glycosyltransferase [Ovoidimarina sediminis]|uniref:glycosyltransferase n=1 Tax=Ovoidimarina sediminis TaxID=3079856 RepID=UPI0029126520|nr:glycosyltransferase [Rhodophyticola sp. MJ-SS7]MDU8942183.1 glycosyltransferase [Rhodophyticola sp. MJ-SS7]
MQGKEPSFSIVSATDGAFDVCRRSLSNFAKQTLRDQIEIVLVGPSIEEMQPDYELLSQFGAYQIIEVGRLRSTGHALSLGFKHARAPFGAFLEEHGFPRPDFVEKLLKTFDETGSDVVGYTLLPQNPGTVAWTHIFLQFGPAVPDVVSGPAKRLGGHHVAYRKEVLTPFGDDLEILMANESVLFEIFRNKNIPMYLTNEITVGHTQISYLPALFRHEFISAMIFADARWKTQNWPVWKRAVYTLGAPAIPFVRVGRSLRDIRRTGRGPEMSVLVLPTMVLSAGVSAMGEAIGYVFGAGRRAIDYRTAVELDRYSYTTEADRKQLVGADAA